MKYFCTFIFIVLVNGVFAQEQQDSIVLKPKKKFLFTLDARRSVALEEKVKIGGFKIGMRVGDSYQLGMGFYGMNTPIRRNIILDKNHYPDSKDTVLFDFDYTTLFFDKIWFKNKRWELSTPFHFGIGTLKLNYMSFDEKQKVKPISKGGALTSELSFVSQFKIIRWFAIGAGFGYRNLLLNDKAVKSAFNAPVYIFQMKLLMGQLYKSVFKKEDKSDDW